MGRSGDTKAGEEWYGSGGRIADGGTEAPEESSHRKLQSNGCERKPRRQQQQQQDKAPLESHTDSTLTISFTEDSEYIDNAVQRQEHDDHGDAAVAAAGGGGGGDSHRMVAAAASSSASGAAPDRSGGWRKLGKLLRSRLVMQDEEGGAKTFVIDQQCPINRYYQVADKVLDRFLQHPADNIEELIEAYLVGTRLSKFLSTVLPSHRGYMDDATGHMRRRSQEQLVVVMQYLDQISLMIDKHEHENYIKSILETSTTISCKSESASAVSSEEESPEVSKEEEDTFAHDEVASVMRYLPLGDRNGLDDSDVLSHRVPAGGDKYEIVEHDAPSDESGRIRTNATSPSPSASSTPQRMERSQVSGRGEDQCSQQSEGSNVSDARAAAEESNFVPLRNGDETTHHQDAMQTSRHVKPTMGVRERAAILSPPATTVDREDGSECGSEGSSETSSRRGLDPYGFAVPPQPLENLKTQSINQIDWASTSFDTEWGLHSVQGFQRSQSQRSEDVQGGSSRNAPPGSDWSTSASEDWFNMSVSVSSMSHNGFSDGETTSAASELLFVPSANEDEGFEVFNPFPFALEESNIEPNTCQYTVSANTRKISGRKAYVDHDARTGVRSTRRAESATSTNQDARVDKKLTWDTTLPQLKTSRIERRFNQTRRDTCATHETNDESPTSVVDLDVPPSPESRQDTFEEQSKQDDGLRTGAYPQDCENSIALDVASLPPLSRRRLTLEPFKNCVRCLLD